MARITLTLRDDEQQALYTLSQKERRHPRQQAAIIVRRELERHGLLQGSDTAECTAKQPAGER